MFYFYKHSFCCKFLPATDFNKKVFQSWLIHTDPSDQYRIKNPVMDTEK